MDGTLTSSTLAVSIAPSRSEADLAISPSGRWVIALGGLNPEITVLRVRKGLAPTILQQIDLPYPDFFGVRKIRYTPSGRFVILITRGALNRVASFRVDSESGELTLFNTVEAPSWFWPQELAITPDGRYALVLSPDILGGEQTVLHVIRIHNDGTLEWLQDKDVIVNGYPSDMEFVPPWRETYPGPQGMVIH